MRRWIFRISVSLLSAAVAVLAWLYIAYLIGPTIKISPQTTYVTGPLKSDGSVDFAAALNAKFGAGLTPENNAMVKLLEAIGPGRIAPQEMHLIYALLEVSPPSDTGRCFVSLNNFASRWETEHSEEADQLKAQSLAAAVKGADHLDEVADESLYDLQDRESRMSLADRLDSQFDMASVRPWSAAEFPALAAWLEANEQPLELIIEASQRPRCYTPLPVNSNSMLMYLPTSMFSEFREPYRALVARAMLRAEIGDVDGALQDLLACHRLARLFDQEPSLLACLVAQTLESLVLTAERALAIHGAMMPDARTRIQDLLGSLPPLAPVAGVIDKGERIFGLDALCCAAKDGFGPIWGGSAGTGVLHMLQLGLVNTAVDWSEVLRHMNRWYDRVAAACRMPTIVQRRAALAELDAELTKISDLDPWIAIVFDSREGQSRRAGNILACILLPALSMVSTVQDRVTAEYRVTLIALALSRYGVKHGRHPDTLAELTPDYIAEVPNDPFTDSPFIYRAQSDGRYLLYSVGPNAIDDDGRDREMANAPGGDTEWDDIVVRSPGLPAVE